MNKYTTNEELKNSLQSDFKNCKLSDNTIIIYNRIIDGCLSLSNFRNYSYNYKQEMKDVAILKICKYWKNIDVNSNIFSYLTTMITRAFIETIKRLNKENDILELYYDRS